MNSDEMQSPRDHAVARLKVISPRQIKRKAVGSSSSRKASPSTTQVKVAYNPVPQQDHVAMNGTNRLPQLVKRKPLNHSLPFLEKPDAVEYAVLPQTSAMMSSKPLWTPLWLKRPVLFAFAAFFTVLSLALISVWRISIKETGFRLSPNTSHYAWTYGPTAFLVSVIALWQQVAYYCKTTQAWQEMKRGPALAERSILLDYMWPTMPETLWTSFRYRHSSVLISIITLLLLRFVTVISTSLIVLRPTDLQTAVTTQVYGKFDASPLLQSLLQPGPYIGDGYSLDNGIHNLSDPLYANVSSRSVYTFLNQLAGQDVDNDGVVAHLAFPTLQIQSTVGNLTSFTSPIEVSETRATCVIADVKVIRCENGLCLTLETDECHAGHQNIRNSTGQLINQTMIPSQEASSWKDLYLFQRVDCDANRDGYAQPSPFWDINATTPYFYQYAFIAANYLGDEDQLLSSTDADLNTPSTMQSSAVLCSIKHDIKQRAVIKDFRTSSYTIGPEQGTLHGNSTRLTDLQFSEVIISAIHSASGVFYPSDTENDGVASTVDMFELMRRTLGATASRKELLNSTTLKDAAAKVLEGVGVRVMSQSVVIPQVANTLGEATYIEDRLQVGLIPLFGMIIGFIIMSALALSMQFTISRKMVLHDPSNIATHAAVLTRSSSLKELLQDCGAFSFDQIKERVNGVKFQTKNLDGFSVETVEHDEVSKILEKESAEAKRNQEETPFMARKAVVAAVLSLPILTIIILEVLHACSDKYGGVLNVTGDDAPESYAIRYGSTFVALLLGTIFDSLDFVIATFAIFSALGRGCVTARCSVLDRSNGSIGPIRFYTSMRKKHYGAALSNAASTIGALLTIIASGLWVYSDTNTVEKAITAVQSTNWDAQWDSSATDRGATKRFNDIQHGAATMPSTVWEDVVLPDVQEISFIGNNDSSSFANSSVTFLLNVPVLRPSLTCEIVPPSKIEVSKYESTMGVQSFWYNDAEVSIMLDPPATCHPKSQQSLSVIAMSARCCGSKGGLDPMSWTGDFCSLEPQSESDLYYTTNISDISFEYKVEGCPSIGAVFGLLNLDMNPGNVTAVVCHQQIQQVMANVTYIRNSTGGLTVDKTHPPLLDESTATFLVNSTTGFPSFSYDIKYWLDHNLTAFPAPEFIRYDNLMYGSPETTETFDTFFNYLMYRSNGTTVDSLNGPQNAKFFIESVAKLYKDYMVHVIDLNFRGNASTSTSTASLRYRRNSQDNTIVHGAAIGPASPRLLIAFESKIVLQILLGIMTILGGASYLMVDLRGTLPRSPWSIASTMALLAGSQMCTQAHLPDGTAEDQKDLIQRWKGQVFSLGWWDNAKDGERFGIDVGEADRLGFKPRRRWKMIPT